MAGRTDAGDRPAQGPQRSSGDREADYQGLVGASSVSLDNTSGVSSYDPTTGALGTQGSVYTNGTLTTKATSKIQGDATAKAFSLANTSTITGQKTTNSTPMTYMPVQVPAGIPSLGAIHLLSGIQTITGPGSFKVNSILLENDAQLLINNLAGPVTLYVTGSVGVENTSHITVLYPDPERFAIYVAGTGLVWMEDSGLFVGVIYAPTSSFSMVGSTQFAGALVGNAMTIKSSAWLYYDQALRGK